jgi:hypothetical protein
VTGELLFGCWVVGSDWVLEIWAIKICEQCRMIFTDGIFGADQEFGTFGYSCAGRCCVSPMETRLDMDEEGTAMEALLGGDGHADRTWQLNVNSFRLPEHQPSESPRTAAADCMKKLSTISSFPYECCVLFR